MKNIFKYFALLPLLTSCDDKKIETNVDYLTQKKWYLESAMVTVTGGGMDTTYDMAAIMPACRLDDFWQYNEDETYVNDNGNTKCDESEEQIQERGTWEFAEEFTVLYQNSTPFTIITLNSDLMILRNQDIEEGRTFTVNYTYKH